MKKYRKSKRSKRKYSRSRRGRNPSVSACMKALKKMVWFATNDPTRYDSINPYSRPAVKEALKVIARSQGWTPKKGKHNYMDAKLNPKSRRRGSNPSIAFDVFLNGKNIDTVFYSANANVDAEEVRRSLINHDGYDSGITVRKARRRKKKA